MTSSATHRLLSRAVRIEPGEVAAALWSAAYIFCLLCAYYILRSVRDEIGSEYVRQIGDYWETVFYVMLVLVPLYAFVVSRWPRRVFIPIANRFFNAQLVILFVLLHVLEGEARGYAEWVFYVWCSAFVMFVLSVFWGFMADMFRTEQGKRLFGFIAFGGSLGGILGPAITRSVVEHIGQVNLFLVSIVLLEVACLCVRRLNDLSEADAAAPKKAEQSKPVSGNILHGFWLVIRNPYLLGIALFIFLYTYGSTVLYIQKGEIARAAFESRDARTAFYADVDLVTNSLAMLCQIFLTGRILPVLGVARTLIIVPALTILGFVALGTWPVLWVLVVFEVARRFTEFAVGRPSREVLFTVVDREVKYKSKPFIDTVVYRGSDVANARIHESLTGAASEGGFGLNLSQIAFIAAPAAAVWMIVAWLLGKRQDAMAQAQEAA